MNPHRLDLVSLSLFSLVVRTGSIGKGAKLAPRAVGAASKRSTQAPRKRSTDLEDAVGAAPLEHPIGRAAG